MRLCRWPFALLAALTAVACTTAPPMPVEPDEDTESVMPARTPAPMIEYPPIEPVEPPEPPVQPATTAAAPAPPAVSSETATPPSVSPPPVVIASIAPEIPTEEQQMTLLLADLQRYGGLNNEEVRRELTTVGQALTRQRTDANRVRLATLYTLAHNPQDDQRALQLLENVAKSGSNGSPGIKQLAAVLQIQITERVRAVRDEQQKADTAIQKLEALRNMERSLLRERVRGGGGGSGSGGSSGGGGGSGGSAGGN